MLCFHKFNAQNKIHTRDNYDSQDLLDDSVDEEALDQQVSKIDYLTLSMCSGIFHSGYTVNMDNYYVRYMSPSFETKRHAVPWYD